QARDIWKSKPTSRYRPPCPPQHQQRAAWSSRHGGHNLIINISSDNGKLFRFNPETGALGVIKDYAPGWYSGMNYNPFTGGYVSVREETGSGIAVGVREFDRLNNLMREIPVSVFDNAVTELEAAWVDPYTGRLWTISDNTYKAYELDYVTG